MPPSRYHLRQDLSKIKICSGKDTVNRIKKKKSEKEFAFGI